MKNKKNGDDKVNFKVGELVKHVFVSFQSNYGLGVIIDEHNTLNTGVKVYWVKIRKAFFHRTKYIEKLLDKEK